MAAAQMVNIKHHSTDHSQRSGSIVQVIHTFQPQRPCIRNVPNGIRGSMAVYSGEHDISRQAVRCGIMLLYRMCRLRIPCIAGTAAVAVMHIIIAGEKTGKRIRQAKITDAGAGGSLFSKRRDTRIFTVQHQDPACSTGSMGEQPCRSIDLPEPVKLVPHNVQQKRILRFYLLNEMHRIRFVQLKHGNIGIDLSAQIHPVYKGGSHPPGKIRSCRVGENLKAQVLQHRRDDTGSCGFAVCP